MPLQRHATKLADWVEPSPVSQAAVGVVVSEPNSHPAWACLSSGKPETARQSLCEASSCAASHAHTMAWHDGLASGNLVGFTCGEDHLSHKSRPCSDALIASGP